MAAAPLRFWLSYQTSTVADPTSGSSAPISSEKNRSSASIR